MIVESVMMKKKRKLKKQPVICLILLIILIIILWVLFNPQTYDLKANKNGNSKNKDINNSSVEKKEKSMSLVMVGDVLIHEKVYLDA